MAPWSDGGSSQHSSNNPTSAEVGTPQGLKKVQSIRWSNDEQQQLIRKGARQVVVLKVTVVILLVLAALLVSVMAYLLIHRQEEDEFHSQFVDLATKIIDQFLEDAQIKLWTCYSLSVAFTTDFEDSGGTWPNATLPRFQLRTFGAATLAHATAIAFSPLVTEDSRREWEAYALENEKLLELDDYGNLGQRAAFAQQQEQVDDDVVASV